MVLYSGQNKETRFYKPSQIGQDDGQSEVEFTRCTEKVVCNRCGAEYADQNSVDMVKRWLARDNYAPCPNLSCPGQLEVKEV